MSRLQARYRPVGAQLDPDHILVLGLLPKSAVVAEPTAFRHGNVEAVGVEGRRARLTAQQPASWNTQVTGSPGHTAPGHQVTRAECLRSPGQDIVEACTRARVSGAVACVGGVACVRGVGVPVRQTSEADEGAYQ